MDYRDESPFEDFNTYPQQDDAVEPTGPTFRDGIMCGALIGFIFAMVVVAVFNVLAKGEP